MALTKKRAAKPKKKTAARKKAPAATKRVAAPKKKAAPRKAAPKKKAAAPKVAPKKKAAAPKAAPKKKAAAPKRRAAPASGPVVRRRDGAGHLDPRYAAELRKRIREERHHDPEGFVGGPGTTRDPLAEQLGEEYVETVTSAEDEGEDVLYQDVPEEVGGPFVISPAGTEFAEGTDLSNPRGAKREPFPTT